MPFLSSIWTWLGLAGVGVAGKLAYSYSSLTFWPNLLSFSAIWRTLMTTLSGIGSLMRTDLLKYFAAATTFSGTIKYLLNGDISLQGLGSTFVIEFYDKVVLTVKNLVEGLSLISKWVAGIDQGFCNLFNTLDVLGMGLLEIWFGVAAYLFILWLWSSSWYDWRNVEMESQEKLLVIGLVSAISISAHSTELVLQGVSNGLSLTDTLAQLGGEWVESEAFNSTVNESVNGSS